jgi:hypothetical protein
MASTVDDRAFLGVISRLASNHTGTWAHLQRIMAFDSVPKGYNTINHEL